jgi:hypothetical protein
LVVRLFRRWSVQKIAISGVLATLLILSPPTARGQKADEVGNLRRENELLKKENELLKKEIDLLKKEAKVKPDGAGNSTTGEKPITKGSYQLIDYELVKCVRDPRNPTRITFTFSAQCDSGNNEVVPFTVNGFASPMIILTVGGGEALNDGRLKNLPPAPVKLRRGVPSKFQMTYEGVEKDITVLDSVQLTVSNFEHRSVTFYNIKIESK